MSARTLVLIALGGGLLALLVLLLSSRDPDEPEARIRAALTEMAQAAGEKNPAGILAHVSDDFEGAGGLDRDRLRGLLFVELRRAGWTRVVLSDVDVVFQSETVADVTARAYLARGEGAIPSNADGWDLTLTFREEGGDWKVSGGRYRSIRR